jgi:hypothetical protein
MDFRGKTTATIDYLARYRQRGPHGPATTAQSVAIVHSLKHFYPLRCSCKDATALFDHRFNKNESLTEHTG